MNGLQKFVKKNGSIILTIVGAAGVVGTSVLTAKATIKATQLVEIATEEKGEALTKKETVRITAPAYIPAVLMGASTIACIFGANILGKRSQAALTSAYALLDQSYKDYKKKVQEIYGEEANDTISRELAKDKYDAEEHKEENDEKRLFYDDYSGQYFRASNETILRAEYELNKMVSDGFGATVNDYFELVGLPKTDYGDYVGWESGQLYSHYWSDWIHFTHQKVIMDDGLECLIISMTSPLVNNDGY